MPTTRREFQDFEFDRALLDPRKRRDGISAFMRVRNGEDFLHLAVLSHLPALDELVIVYNRCTDRTPQIIERLAQAFPEKIRAIHYLPEVRATGSRAHAEEPPGSVHSIVNYYNFALSQTSCRVVTKLDDDHLGVPRRLAEVTQRIRREGCRGRYLAHSGLNIAGDIGRGETLVYANEPFGGNGDHGFFEVTQQTYFVFGPHTERPSAGMKKNRLYTGLLYYHLKLLKPNHGFANYELESNPDSRYNGRLKALREQARYQPLAEFLAESRAELKINARTAKGKAMARVPPLAWRALRHLPLGKVGLVVDRGLSLPEEAAQLPTPQQILEELGLQWGRNPFLDEAPGEA